MASTVDRRDPVEASRSTRWQRIADRLVRVGWLVLLAAVAVALAGGALGALVPDSGGDDTGGGGGPGWADVPWIVSMLGYGLAILLGLPSLLAGGWDLARGRRSLGARRLLPFLGPVLVFVGIELLPHLLNPCTIPYELGRRDLPGICQTDPDWGADVESRYHLLDHALVGALPLAALYSLALRRWRPAVAHLH